MEYDDQLYDSDWIEISDDTIDESFEEDKEMYGSLSVHTNYRKMRTDSESFRVSCHGSFQFDGLPQSIKRTGFGLDEGNKVDPSKSSGSPGSLTLMESRLQIIEIIGKGTFSTVYKAFDTLPTSQNNVVALKKLYIKDKQQRRHFVQELLTINETRDNCPNLLTFIDAFSFSHECSVGMIFEYMDCTLEELVVLNNSIGSEIILAYISRECLRGLKYLHDSRHLIHRDVKPSNLLINALGDVKIGDFGLSKKIVASGLTSFLGTMKFMAPERIRGEQYSYCTDIYSLGVSLLVAALGIIGTNRSYWELLHENNLKMQTHILAGDNKKWSSSIRGFIEQALEIASKRPEAEQLLGHDFVAHDGVEEGRGRLKVLVSKYVHGLRMNENIL